MDLIYGNDGMNYRIFGQSGGLSPEAAAKIQKGYMGYRFPANTAAYSSAMTEPEAFIYVTSNLGKALPEEKVILVKNGIMPQFSTPSYYCHAHVMDSDNDFYRSRFFSIFRASFIGPAEASECNDDMISRYEMAFDENVQENALTREQIRAVLYMFFYNERKGSPVRILLDEEGDRYNERSREVLNCIYHYLPYDIRRRFGFASYMDEQQSSLSRVGFELFDRTQMKSMEGIDVDLRAPAADTMRSRLGKPEVCEYLDRLVDMTEEERTAEFDNLSELFGTAAFDLNEAIKSAVYGRTWKEQPVEDLIPEWADYLLTNGFVKGPIYRNLVRIIQERLDNRTYNAYLLDKVEKGNVDLLHLPEDIRRIVLMADAVDGLELNTEDFVIYQLDRMGDGQSTPDLEMLRDRAEKLDIGSEEYKAVTKGIAEAVGATLDERKAQAEAEKAAAEQKRLEEIRIREEKRREERLQEEKRREEAGRQEEKKKEAAPAGKKVRPIEIIIRNGEDLRVLIYVIERTKQTEALSDAGKQRIRVRFEKNAKMVYPISALEGDRIIRFILNPNARNAEHVKNMLTAGEEERIVWEAFLHDMLQTDILLCDHYLQLERILGETGETEFREEVQRILRKKYRLHRAAQEEERRGGMSRRAKDDFLPDEEGRTGKKQDRIGRNPLDENTLEVSPRVEKGGKRGFFSFGRKG